MLLFIGSQLITVRKWFARELEKICAGCGCKNKAKSLTWFLAPNMMLRVAAEGFVWHWDHSESVKVKSEKSVQKAHGWLWSRGAEREERNTFEEQIMSLQLWHNTHTQWEIHVYKWENVQKEFNMSHYWSRQQQQEALRSAGWDQSHCWAASAVLGWNQHTNRKWHQQSLAKSTEMSHTASSVLAKGCKAS